MTPTGVPDHRKSTTSFYSTTNLYRQYERERKRAWRARTGNIQKEKPFIGIDGEGGNIPEHEYLLLRAGDSVLETGKPLEWRECLDFLCDLPRDAIYVGYYFDYDVTMILRGLPEERLHRLFDREARTFDKRLLRVDVGREFQIDYLPRKELRVRRVLDNGKYSHWTVVNDVGSFFQCSFVAALEKWGIGSQTERKQIADGKSQRSDFLELTDDTRYYNGLEIKLLGQLMEQFRDSCKAVGYVPTIWQGPGNLASTMLRKHNIPKTKQLPHYNNDLFNRTSLAAQSSYYGGRFETTAIGHIPGPIYQYDINSAYPYIIQNLPCLEHAIYRHDDKGHYVIRHVTFESISPAHLYALPIRRKDGSIFFPGSGQGWYWQKELDGATFQKYKTLDAYSFNTPCECKPFNWIDNIYQARKGMGKSGRGIVLKLGMNSLYGKMCQSIGAAPYANPIYASYITALTRALLYRVAIQGGDIYPASDCLMLATDGIFTRYQRKLTIGTELGQWEETIHPDGMFIIQPGLYFTTDKLMPKTRGVPRQKIIDHAEQFRTQVATLEPIPIELTNFIGLRMALARNKPEIAGQWHKVIRNIEYAWQSKREKIVKNDGNSWTTYPYQTGQPTVPYNKNIGKIDYEMLDQPDWTPILYGEELT